MSSGGEKFTFIWKIDHFLFSPNAFNEPITSPLFKVDKMHKTSWILKCYPRGVRNKLVIAIKLCRAVDDSGPGNIGVSIKSCILASDGSFLFEKEKESFIFSKGGETTIIREKRDEFFEKPRILSSMGTLTVYCQVWKSTENNENAGAETGDKPLDSLGEVFQNACEEICKENPGTCTLCDFYPQKYCARTRFHIENRSFNYHINDFSALKTSCNITFVAHSSSDQSLSLLLTLRFSDEPSNIDLYIRPLLKEIDRSFFVRSKIYIQSNKGNPFCVQNDSHIFRSKEDLMWKTSFRKYAFSTGRHLYLLEDVLSLKFELTICNGTQISEIEEINHVAPIAFSKKENSLIDQLLTFYMEQRFCDVEFKASNSTVQTHKAVICSRSPVFQAMFENDMKERIKGVVDVTDFGITTVKKMLHFMYSETFENLLIEDALELYSIADKYEYETLKKHCSLFLESNIQPGNVYKILSLSDMHSDEVLKTASLDFIRLNAHEVFSLEEWKTFIQNNVLLASEVLGYISSVIRNS